MKEEPTFIIKMMMMILLFYSSPLAKLDRLTLKLLDSEGNNVKESAMKDIDIDTPSIDGTNMMLMKNIC